MTSTIDVSSIESNPKSWKLVGEGASSIAISKGSPENTSALLLVIKKFSHRPCDRREDLVDIEIALIDMAMRQWFGDQYISKTMDTFIPSAIFLSDLAAHVEDQRSIGRKRQMSPLVLSQSTVILMQNFHRISKSIPVMPHSRKNQQFSIELKVKSGIKSYSPFIPASRDIKIGRSRFELIQMCKAKRAAEEGPDLSFGTFAKVNYYDPCNLCSGDIRKVSTELKLLFSNPQNNLQMRIDDELLYGGDKIRLEEALRAADLALFSGEYNGSTKEIEDALVYILASLLCTESALPLLQQMQNLDLLDVEGAAYAYEHLKKKVGTKGATDDIILRELLIPINDFLRRNIVSESHVITAGLHEEQLPDIVQALLRLRDKNKTVFSVEERSALVSAAEALVDSSSITDASFLIKMWFLALIAKDASVVIALESTGEHRIQLYTNLDEDHSLSVTPQTNEYCGQILSRDGTPCFLYSVGLIDIGLKDIDKVWVKNIEEDDLCAKCASFIAEP